METRREAGRSKDHERPVHSLASVAGRGRELTRRPLAAPLVGAAVGVAVLALAWGAASAPPAKSARPVKVDALVADLSDHAIGITTGFSGTKVLLFGAVEGEGDIVVEVRGPARAEIVRRRQRLFGLWVNRASATIDGAPSFYTVDSTRPLSEIVDPSVRERRGLGLDHLALKVERDDKTASEAEYRAALIRLKERAGLYREQAGTVSVLGGRLFRTAMELPANVPTGTFTVAVYLIRKGDVASVQTTPLVIDKSGISAEIFDFAQDHASLYGVGAVIAAVAAGWLAAAAFRKA